MNTPQQHRIPDAPPLERSVYIIQNVIGYGRGATARYTLTTDDGARLESLEVELRTGRFNITQAFEGANPLLMSPLNAFGHGRLLSLEVTDLPPFCEPNPASMTVDSLRAGNADGRIILEITITCADPTE